MTGRGRPKGSKNKKTKEKPVEEKKVEDQSNVKTPEKGKRGRPKGHHQPSPMLNNSSKKLFNKANTHVYTELAKTSLGNTELYNLYGIVIDATTPHRKQDQGYKTHIKIIDPSMYIKNVVRDQNDSNSGCISVTIFSKYKEQLPAFKKVGEIIRIHRCNIGQFKGQKTFCVIMSYGSSWAIFEGMPQLQKSEEEDDEDIDSQVEVKETKKVKSEEAISKFFGFGEQQNVSVISNLKQNSNENSVCSSNSEITVPQNYLPYKLSSKDYTLGLVDRDILKRYRKWMQEYFKSEFFYDNTLHFQLAKVRDFISGAQILGQEPKIKEYDLIVKIDSIKVEESKVEDERLIAFGITSDIEFTTLKISDASCGDFELRVPLNLIPEGLNQGDIVKITKVGLSKNNQKKNALEALEHSNIMIIDKNFKIYQNFHENLEQFESDLTKVILGDNLGNIHQNEFSHLYTQVEEVIEKPEIASTVAEQFKQIAPSELADILYSNPSQSQQRLFRIRCYVLNIQPLNLYELTQLFCHRCYTCFSYRDFSVSSPQCSQCHQELHPIFKIQFMVKDKSLYQLQGAIKLLLYTMDGQSDKFFNGIQPTNLYKDQNARQRIEAHLRHLVRFNVYLDAIVERKQMQEEVVFKLINCRLKPQ